METTACGRRVPFEKCAAAGPESLRRDAASPRSSDEKDHDGGELTLRIEKRESLATIGAFIAEDPTTPGLVGVALANGAAGSLGLEAHGADANSDNLE